MSTLPTTVRVVEVGPRDGLQNEREIVPTATKIAFIKALAAAGLKQIEATSFVNPKIIPKLSDASEVIAGLPRLDQVVFSALVPNERGLDRAIASGVKRIAIFTAASETFAQKNIGVTIEKSLEEYERVCTRASEAGISIRGYVSTAFVCPFEGNIDPSRVRDISKRLMNMGADEVAISDTIGAAVPTDVVRTLEIVAKSVSVGKIALHFHDTYGTALVNVLAGLQFGVTTFDSSAGGLGGCPFAPGASGNLATEDLVYTMHRMGIDTDVSLDGVVQAAELIARTINRPLASAGWRRWKGSSQSGCGQTCAST
ncbi:MAG: hydroxymethylglutaryl-CoA lyase [Planctomycetes bacterium]|nr:hydroxymethylglutaryl-CoA lyase [Planctomycetota bacterium]MBI3835625.1 hydroxymethylglutaryl-CoA lyase [Planctomycetota bacterium]